MTKLTTPTGHYLGWVPDLPDARDLLLENHVDGRRRKLPPAVDLRPDFPAVYDQGQLGSCTANSIAAGVEFLMKREQIVTFDPSRLFIYYQERLDQGDTANDTGASIRESAKAVATYGCPPETEWPYDIGKFAQKPPAKAYEDALKTVVTQYLRVSQTAASMKGCLAAGFPIHVGFTVYSSFESAATARTGVVTMPNLATEQVLGGHAIVIVGYDDARGVWLCRNSWGHGWGNNGYFTAPYAFFLDSGLASDFWTLRATSLPPQPTPGPKPAPAAYPQAPFQRTQPPTLDPATNEWVWEFRVGRGTGDWT